MTRIADMHKKWMKEPKYRKAYEALETEFALLRPPKFPFPLWTCRAL